MSVFVNGIHNITVGNGVGFKVRSQGMQYLEGGSGKVVVCFSAAVSKRELRQPPFFSGRNLSKELSLPVISIADTSLEARRDLNLAWYAGSSSNPHLQVQIRDFLACLMARVQTLILIGGSGGGFAALTQLHLLQSSELKCLVWNPQTDIFNYNEKYVNRYIECCFPDFSSYSNEFRKKSLQNIGVNPSLLNLPKPKGKLVYLQNSTDSHVHKHAMPYWSWLGKGHNFDFDRGSNRLLDDGFDGQLRIDNFAEKHSPPDKEIIKDVLLSI